MAIRRMLKERANFEKGIGGSKIRKSIKHGEFSQSPRSGLRATFFSWGAKEGCPVDAKRVLLTLSWK